MPLVTTPSIHTKFRREKRHISHWLCWIIATYSVVWRSEYTIPTEHAENLAMLLFSHFATHAVCSSPYLLTTLACQTCFATWRWRVVSSLEVLELSTPCLLAWGRNAMLEASDVGSRCQTTELRSSSKFCQGYFFGITLLVCHCDPSEQRNELKNWALWATLPFQSHFWACRVPDFCSEQHVKSELIKTFCLFTQGLQHWLAND